MPDQNQIPPVDNRQIGDSLENLLEKNIALSQEVLESVKYVKRYIRWQKVFGWIKVLIIAIPIIWGILYLPPLLDDWLASYMSSSAISNIDFSR